MSVAAEEVTAPEPWQPRQPSSRVNWEEDAACKGVGAEVLFGHSEEKAAERNRREAIVIGQFCLACTVREDCLLTALSEEREYGVWGGTTERDRRKYWEGGLKSDSALIEKGDERAKVLLKQRYVEKVEVTGTTVADKVLNFLGMQPDGIYENVTGHMVREIAYATGINNSALRAALFNLERVGRIALEKDEKGKFVDIRLPQNA